ncbi:dynein axonemal assembly factor 19 isoform X4 [Peromyscus maniculatus bairdii]|uniref:Coiled-coil domain containing 103 n=1 Tax=Peromyscus maniculatus bairdii TaxID=230844 RepID=A0A6I9L2J5_PERMB|nr:coiled-coil domain-containing protein 103 [Peromyscus maniculatus bairdii]XP_042138845.1 coiled-coil domain-containing protein 103 [Peromyscus maniculatus bairdii]
MEKNDAINFKTLEKELQAALAADEKYKRENAAKLRAVEQRVPSYEEFRGIVLASHLKPLEQKDKVRGKRTVPWNCHSTRERTFQDVATEIPQEKSSFQPATSAEFYRDWRRHLRSGPERYQALLQLGGAELGHLFRMDVGFGLLGELLVALAEHVKPSDRTAVLGILHRLANTGRFPLNLSLLSPAEREGCQRLFEKLQAMGTARPMQGGLGMEEEPAAGLQGEEELLRELLGLYGVH